MLKINKEKFLENQGEIDRNKIIIRDINISFSRSGKDWKIK